MQYRTLGKTGLKVSAIGVGSWQLSGPMTLDGKPDGYPDIGFDNAVRLIQSCGEIGINIIDTAEVYGDGEGERRIGQAISGRRSEWILSSKFGMRRGPDGCRVRDSSPKAIIESLEGSLRRLRTDFIDIYMHHTPQPGLCRDEELHTLGRLREEGKVRFIGVSTNDPVVAAEFAGHIDVIMFAQSLLATRRQLMRLVRSHNLGCLVRGVYASGALSGRHAHDDMAFPADDIRSLKFTPGGLARYAALQNVLPAEISIGAAALRYVLDLDTTHSTMIGGRTIDDYRTAADALAMPPLPATLRRKLRRRARLIETAGLGRSQRASRRTRDFARSIVDAAADRLALWARAIH